MTTCPREQHLLRFEVNSTATSNGAQKFGNNVWHDSELIATKVCSQIGIANEMQCLNAMELRFSNLHVWNQILRKAADLN